MCYLLHLGLREGSRLADNSLSFGYLAISCLQCLFQYTKILAFWGWHICKCCLVTPGTDKMSSWAWLGFTLYFLLEAGDLLCPWNQWEVWWAEVLRQSRFWGEAQENPQNIYNNHSGCFVTPAGFTFVQTQCPRVSLVVLVLWMWHLFSLNVSLLLDIIMIQFQCTEHWWQFTEHLHITIFIC